MIDKDMFAVRCVYFLNFLFNVIYRDNSVNCLEIVANSKVYPSPVIINFVNTIAPTIPNLGISDKQANILVGIKMNGEILQPQPINIVQNIGAITSARVRTIAESREESPVLLNSNFDRGVFIDIDINITAHLVAGDQVHLHAPNFTFNYDTEFIVYAVYSETYSATSDANEKTAKINKFFKDLTQ
jgi:hypothetical protein